MKVKRSIFAVGLTAAFVLVSCSLPTLTAPTVSSTGGPTPATVSSSGGGTPALQLTTNASGTQGILITPNGERLVIASVSSNGTRVSCATPYGISFLRGDTTSGSGSTDSAGQPAVIFGKTSDGRPGIWIYHSGKFEAPWNEDTNGPSSSLGDSDQFDGMMKGRFGWTYTVTGHSADGRLYVGIAENKKGITIGNHTIAAGTTIGVYWRVWRDHDHHGFFASRARIIGVYTPDIHGHDSWRHHDFRDGWWHRFDLLKALLFGRLTSYLTALDMTTSGGNSNTEGHDYTVVSYDKTTSTYSVSGTDQNGDPATATFDKYGKVLSITPSPAPPTQTVDLTVGKITAPSSAEQTVSFNVSFDVQNNGTGVAPAGSTVDLYLSTDGTFPASGTPLKTVTVNSTIGANGGTVSETNVQVTIPGTLGANEAVYIYADVSPATGTTDSNPANNISTSADAALLVAYSGAPALTKYYNVIVETYGVTGGSSNPGISLFSSNGSKLKNLNYASTSGSNTYNSLSYTSSTALGQLPSGTYYLAVFPLSQTGPYAVGVRTDNLSQIPFNVALQADPDTSNDGTQSNGMLVDQGNWTTYTSPLPTIAKTIDVGGALNWFFPTTALSSIYIYGNVESDWFTFTLP